MGRRRKINIAQNEFNNKIKVWTLIVSLFVSILSSVVTIAIAYKPTVPQVKQQFSISPDDKLELSLIRKEYNEYIRKYHSPEYAGDDVVLEVYHEALIKLSDNEAMIMHKYDRGFLPRFPHVIHQQSDSDSKILDFLLVFILFTLLIFSCSKPFVTKFLLKKYIVMGNTKYKTN